MIKLQLYCSIQRLLSRAISFSIISLLMLAELSCNKLVQIDAPRSTIVTTQVFGDSADALSAMEGLYATVSGSGPGGFGLSIQSGTSADELMLFGSPLGGQADNQMYNAIQGYEDGEFYNSTYWSPSYTSIYQANAIIEGMNESKGVLPSQRSQYIGEALFFRAFLHFYLANLFGPVPIVTSTDYVVNTKVTRRPVADVYRAVINDLLIAKDKLNDDYSTANGERVRVNKWAATALLARVYLFNQQWDSAQIQASLVIGNTALFKLNPDLNSVFSVNNPEAILQWNLNTTIPPYNALQEALFVIPYDNTSPTNVYLNQQLYDAFEPGDNRKSAWINQTNYGGTDYYYPFKYKIGPKERTPNAQATEYYMVLRLAEQYLIRAEARAHLNDLEGAEADLKLIRDRAGLSDLPSSLTQAQVLAAVMQERRVELFSEWGHRWLDLKRTGAIDSVMTVATPLKNGGTTWHSYQQLYPIPYSEMQKSSVLTQNPGY